MTSIDLTIWVPIIGTWVLVIGTLAFAYWQVRQAGRLHSATTLLDLRERFYNPRLRMTRRNISTWLLSTERGPEPENWEVALFFEMLGSLTRARVLDKRMVWSAFGVWLTSYFVAMTEPENMIERWRKESTDPSIFREFEWLAREMIEFDKKLVGPSAPNRSAIQEARDMLEYETHLQTEGPIPY